MLRRKDAGIHVKAIFHANDFEVRPVTSADFESTLKVYEQCEDFLSLGPVPKASKEMVQADIDHSKSSNGIFCGIWDKSGTQVGVLDFIPEMEKGIAFLSLLMISEPYRYGGIGTVIVAELEAHLMTNYKTRILKSGVQTNNAIGIKFWKKCGFILETKPTAIDDGTVAYQMQKRFS
jgi:RimJ/RimL family protein N-acetyltransferase